MNIALFTETYYPEINGVATSVLMLKTELEQRGHNVYVFTTKTPGAPEREFNVFRVPSLPFALLTERRVGLFYQPRLAGIIKRLNLDVIHTHTEFSLGIFGRIMAKELRIPIIHTYHTIYEDYTHYVTHSAKIIDDKAKAAVRTFTKVCCNHVEQVVVPTEKVKELLTDYDVVKDIAVVPTGIDLRKFDRSNFTKEEIISLREQFGVKASDKVILYLGRISKEKNLQEVIDAMPEYLADKENVKFVIVGNGPDKERLSELVNELELNNKIIFTGEQPWDIIAKFYQLGDVFVSASNSETQGLTYIEAMASGLPVVAREDRCLDDILIDGENGYSFTTKEGLMEGLDKVLFGNIEKFSENSIRIVSRYSTEEFAKNIELVYQKVISQEKISDFKYEYSIKKYSKI
ncbi:glycosyltransferase family 4 protein [Anaeromicropila herbilytica]|uniref:Glycosyl transferase family 1 n=1 Tax=Anaeromicropila herbilytica TaxID=2785025 RepID=A0A7R7IEC5_9FIRM|nr:glycosyltransferase family 4 protein [Anaeromicropila herbilytica]BCN32497.1 glycosyl transferase family 1 [Anaeromicropila herbilytica]